MSGGITEFLSELTETESLSTLRLAHKQKSAFIFKVETHLNPITAYIENFSDKRAILTTEISDVSLPTDKEISMKFNVGTEIFFVKTHVKSYLNRYYFDMLSKVIQLKRRKEPRFLIPPKFNQTAAVINPDGDVPSKVLDISLSGIRFELLKPSTVYQRDDVIKVKFQIHKRAEVQSVAIVRFALNRPGANQILGLEFAADITDINKGRVANIVEDIQIYNSTIK